MHSLWDGCSFFVEFFGPCYTKINHLRIICLFIWHATNHPLFLSSPIQLFKSFSDCMMMSLSLKIHATETHSRKVWPSKFNPKHFSRHNLTMPLNHWPNRQTLKLLWLKNICKHKNSMELCWSLCVFALCFVLMQAHRCVSWSQQKWHKDISMENELSNT